MLIDTELKFNKSYIGNLKIFEMKLLVVINNLEAGGAEKLIVTTLPLINNADVNVTLLLISAKKSEKLYIKHLKNCGIQVIDLNCKSVYSLAAIIKIRTQLKKVLPDIIHVHLFPAMYWTALATFFRTKIPLVFTEHSTHNRRLNSVFFKYLDKFIYTRYKFIICITEAVKEILFRRYNCTNTIVINNGIDLIEIENTPKINRKDLLSRLNVDNENAKFVFMAARFEYPKRQDVLIEVLQLLPYDCHLVFAGIGSKLKECKELVSKFEFENRVHFLGFCADTISMMKSVDVNILLSDYEGLSGVTMEGLASGVPFLGSNVSGINNVVPDHNYLFDNTDIAEISNKILLILSNDQYAHGHSSNGKSFVRRFDVQNMVSSYINLYNKTLNS